MKKTLLLLTAVTAFATSSCKENKENEAMEENEIPVMVEETIIEEPNKSDLALENAFDQFNAKEYTAAAESVKTAIAELKIEGSKLTGKPQEQLEESIRTLNKIELMLRDSPKTETDAQLAAAFTHAESEVSHAYLYMADYFALEQPKTSAAYLKQGLKHLDKAKPKTAEPAKPEAKK